MTRYIVPIVSAAFALFSAASLAQEVTITAPQNGEEVGMRAVVSGTSKDVQDGNIWVLVHLKLLTGLWWPQNRPVVDDQGNWQALVSFGGPQDIGMDFEIAAAVFDDEAEAEILRYHDRGRRTNDWQPMAFPKSITAPVTVTVKKAGH